MRISDWSSDVCSSDLIPVLRQPRMRADANRTGMNVDVYRERMYELEMQRNAGILDVAQFEAGRTEAARELLDDAPGPQRVGRARLGRLVPLTAAFAIPLLALAMYRSEEHTSELQSLMRISYAVFCLKKQTNHTHQNIHTTHS